MEPTTLTPTLLTLIVATIELVTCLACAILLWTQRRDMPDRSRLMLALGAAHCVLTSSLKLVAILASPTRHFYQETLPPDLTMWGMLSMLLILAYPVTVARPEWFRSMGGVILFLLPGLLFMAVHQRFLRFDEQVESRKLYTQPGISRDELCRVMGVDRTTFSRIISEHSGCHNMADYLNRKRIAEAVRLMHQHPNYTLQAIMEDCGYSNKMTFNRVFKDTYGTTPSEYRQRLGKDT